MKNKKKIIIIISAVAVIAAVVAVLYFNLQNDNQNSRQFVSGEVVSVDDEKIVVRSGSVDLSANKVGQDREVTIYYNDQTLVNKTLPGYAEFVSEEISKITKGSIVSAEYEVSSDDRFRASKIILLNE